MIVADANLIAYLVIPGTFTADAERVLERDEHWVAPRLWRTEFTSILLKYLRAGTMTPSAAEEHLAEAAVQIADEFEVDHADVLRTASGSGASAYDCEYVVVARYLGVPLVTADQRLAARFPGIALTLADFAAS